MAWSSNNFKVNLMIISLTRLVFHI